MNFGNWRMVALWCALVGGVSTLAAPVDIFAAAKALGRGVNIGNYLEAPRDASWGVTIRDDDFTRIRAAGFDAVRLPVRWSAYAAKESPYTIEPKFFERVDHLLDAATTAGLKVVLNVHHYEELDKDPAGHSDRLLGMWKQIAGRYRSRPDSVYFELYNEPHDKFDGPTWNQLLARGVAVIRETNPTRPVIVGPISWNNVSALPKLELPSDQRLIVTFHYYSPFEFTHQGATWTDEKVRTIRDREWNGTESELGALRKDFDAAATWAASNRRPIYVGEFGAYEKAPAASRARWTAAVAREAEARGFSWSYWEYSSGFGAYNPGAGAWREPLLRALVPPRP